MCLCFQSANERFRALNKTFTRKPFDLIGYERMLDNHCVYLCFQSANERFRAFAEIETQAVLSLDDNVAFTADEVGRDWGRIRDGLGL